MLDDDNPLNTSTEYLLHLAVAAEAQGLITGIRWGVPKQFSNAIDTAIANKNWKAPVKVGWDPTHVRDYAATG